MRGMQQNTEGDAMKTLDELLAEIVDCWGHPLALAEDVAETIFEAGYALVPLELTREIGDAMIKAVWPMGVYDDEFDGPEQQLAAGYKAMIKEAGNG